MKFKLFTIPCVVLLAITFLIASCSKGPTGAAGAAGPAGPQGSPGTAGTAGAPGTPGTANVIYSAWIDTVSYQPYYTDSSAWIAQIVASGLVDSILNKGVIQVYCNIGSDSTNDELILALPITDVNITNVIITPYYSLKTITLSANGDASSFTSGAYHHFRYRYILIPGAILAGGRGIKPIDWKDYKQVKAFLKLND
ncbi:MAG: hypothetical protein ABI863_21625 [Ginsengibacter sp.]